jgi:DNA invertase Pin-like site-specific DNA recombinase
MMAAAVNGEFDVLVAGYASRFMRNLHETLNAVNDHLHPAGVVVLFADERLLSSDPNHWDQFIREALEAESFSRKLSKRVHEGYAAKLRRTGVPGGNRAPLGTSREGRPSRLSIDEEKLALVRYAYDLSAGGMTDREVAAKVGLRLTHVREVLTNPFYAGWLSDDSPSALGALIEPAIWDKVQALRSRYSRRHRGSVHRRQYALSGLLFCGACQQRLTGHGGRYRHVDACATFRAAAPRAKRAFSRNYDGRVRGQSYSSACYDDLVGAALGKAAVSAKLMTATMPKALSSDPAENGVDLFTSARLERDRRAATDRYMRNRDVLQLQATMARLDAEERQAEDRGSSEVTPEKAKHYLENLSELWNETEPEGQRAIAESAIDHIEAVGLDLLIDPSAEAERYGLAEAFGSEPLVCSISQSGRGERI